jgi:hypothetical protein
MRTSRLSPVQCELVSPSRACSETTKSEGKTTGPWVPLVIGRFGKVAKHVEVYRDSAQTGSSEEDSGRKISIDFHKSWRRGSRQFQRASTLLGKAPGTVEHPLNSKGESCRTDCGSTSSPKWATKSVHSVGSAGEIPFRVGALSSEPRGSKRRTRKVLGSPHCRRCFGKLDPCLPLRTRRRKTLLGSSPASGEVEKTAGSLPGG